MRNFFNVYFGHDFELNIGLNTLQAIVNVWMNDQNLSSRASANDGFYFVMEQLKWTLKHHKHTILLKLRPFIEFWKGVIYKKAKCKGWNLKIDFSFNRFYGSKPEASKDTRVHKTTEIFFILYFFTINHQSTSRPTT